MERKGRCILLCSSSKLDDKEICSGMIRPHGKNEQSIGGKISDNCFVIETIRFWLCGRVLHLSKMSYFQFQKLQYRKIWTSLRDDGIILVAPFRANLNPSAVVDKSFRFEFHSQIQAFFAEHVKILDLVTLDHIL